MTRQACLGELAAAIAALRLPHTTRVAIDGVDGAGKTTLADELVEPIRRFRRDVIRASVDGFHNPRAVRYTRGSGSPEGYFRDSFNYAALRNELLEPLGPLGNGNFRTAVFDYRSDQAVERPREIARRDAILLFDGVFLMRPELDGLWDVTIWLEVPFEVTVERAVARAARGGEEPSVVRGQYERRYVPGQRLYLTECRPRERADIVLDNAALAHPSVTFRRSRDAARGALQTPSLRLVPQTRADLLAMIEAMTPPEKAQLSQDWLARFQVSTTADPWVHGFRLVRRDSGTIVGTCSFKGPPADGIVEIAYGIAAEEQGKGYATEAAQALVAYASAFPEVRVIRAHTLPEPNASTRVLAKSGFRRVGEVMDPEDGPVWRFETTAGGERRPLAGDERDVRPDR